MAIIFIHSYDTRYKKACQGRFTQLYLLFTNKPDKIKGNNKSKLYIWLALT